MIFFLKKRVYVDKSSIVVEVVLLRNVSEATVALYKHESCALTQDNQRQVLRNRLRIHGGHKNRLQICLVGDEAFISVGARLRLMLSISMAPPAELISSDAIIDAKKLNHTHLASGEGAKAKGQSKRQSSSLTQSFL